MVSQRNAQSQFHSDSKAFWDNSFFADHPKFHEPILTRTCADRASECVVSIIIIAVDLRKKNWIKTNWWMSETKKKKCVSNSIRRAVYVVANDSRNYGRTQSKIGTTYATSCWPNTVRECECVRINAIVSFFSLLFREQHIRGWK